MMNFDEFLEATRARVQEELPDTAVKIQQVNKLQGESYVGISVQPEGAAAAATFNIGPAFERYQADPSQEGAILDKIAADAKQVSAAIPVFEVNSITDYASAKNHLVMQVVPVEPNKEMLENIPHKTVEDKGVPRRHKSYADSLTKKKVLTNKGKREARFSDNPDYLTVDEAALLAKVSTARVYKWISAGRFPALRISKMVTRIPRKEFEAFLEENINRK